MLLNNLDYMWNKLELFFLVLYGKYMYVFIINFYGKELCYLDVWSYIWIMYCNIYLYFGVLKVNWVVKICVCMCDKF